MGVSHRSYIGHECACIHRFSIATRERSSLHQLLGESSRHLRSLHVLSDLVVRVVYDLKVLDLSEATEMELTSVWICVVLGDAKWFV